MGLYSLDHIVFILIFLAVLFVSVVVILVPLKQQSQKDLFIRCFGAFLTVWIVVNRISLAVWKGNALELIPNTFCGVTSLLLGISAMVGKPHSKIFDFLFYVEIFGGLITVFYSNFLLQGPSFWFFPTLSGMAHHAAGVVLCILLILGGWFEPSIKRWYMYPIGVSVYTIFGLFLLDALKIPDTMYIDSPILAGTPLKWWFMLIFGTIAVALISAIYDFIKAKVKVKNSQTVVSTK